MTVKFLRVIGIRSQSPSVVALVDGIRVRWNGGDWTTDCDCPEDVDCTHVGAVVDLLDPRVIGEDQ